MLEHGHHAHYISILKTALFISSRMLIKKKKFFQEEKYFKMRNKNMKDQFVFYV